jgi:hypothetical protein
VSCTTTQDTLVDSHFITTGHIGDAALDSVVPSGWELAGRELGPCTLLNMAQGLARANGRDPP